MATRIPAILQQHYRGGGGYSADAKAIFALMPDALTSKEKDAIATFVDNDVNWALRDQFIWPLNTVNNSLTDWTGQQNMIRINTPSLTLNSHWLFDGINQCLDNNIALSSLSKYGADQDDGLVWCNVKDNLTAGNAWVFGAIKTSATATWTTLRSQGPSNGVKYSVNNPSYTAFGSGIVLDDTTYHVARFASADYDLYADGVKQDDGTHASTAINSLNMYFGCYNGSGAPQGFWNGEMRGCGIGTAVGFDFVTDEINIQQLITDLA